MEKPNWQNYMQPQETLFDNELADTTLDEDIAPEVRTNMDRFEAVYNVLGFIPHSRQELNYATSALDHSESPAGFAKFLNNVLIHQDNSVSKEPRAALLSITQKIIGYYNPTAARMDETTIAEILGEIEEYKGAQNFMALSRVSSLDGWKSQPSTQRGLGLISREVAALKALEARELFDFEKVVQPEAITAMMDTTRVSDTFKIAVLATSHAKARQEFWKKRLEEAQRHGATRTIAQKALVASTR